MGFSSINAVNAAKGLQGTSRRSATFTGLGGAPSPGMQGAAQGAAPAPVGSSYSTAGGMQNTSRMAGPSAAVNSAANGPDANGVIAGRQAPMADVGQIGPQLTAAQMQDPENAALAGFQFAQTQDAPVQASTPVAMPPTAGGPKPFGADAQRSAQVQPQTMGPPAPAPQQQAQGSNIAAALGASPLMKPPPQYGRMM